MSGYRQSSFEPNHWEPMGPPVRPYNWVQWCGVVFDVIGIGVLLAYFAGRIGWAPKTVDDPMLGISLAILGMALVNTRRQPVAPEDRDRIKRRTTLALTVAVVVAVIAAGIAIYMNRHGA